MYELGICATVIYGLLEIYLTARIYIFLKRESSKDFAELNTGSLIFDRIVSCIFANVFLCIPLVYLIGTLL